jgi:hypothetical protein
MKTVSILFTATALILTALNGTSASALAAKEPLRLKATSNWVVDYKEAGCTLFREFGEGKEKTLVYFNRFAPGDGFKLTIGSKLFGNASGREPAKIQFGPTEEVQEYEYFVGNVALVSDDKMPGLIFKNAVNLDGWNAEQKAAWKKNKSLEGVPYTPMNDTRRAAITYLEIGKPLGKGLILETGSMAKPMTALSQCVDNLVASWGVDVEKYKTAKSLVTPLGDPGKWVRPDEYPTNMVSEGQPALVEFRLNVSEQGVATSCHIQATTRPKEFDNAVCKTMMRRAKFTPAQDAAGQPFASFYNNTVRFEIGGY